MNVNQALEKGLRGLPRSSLQQNPSILAQAVGWGAGLLAHARGQLLEQAERFR